MPDCVANILGSVNGSRKGQLPLCLWSPCETRNEIAVRVTPREAEAEYCKGLEAILCAFECVLQAVIATGIAEEVSNFQLQRIFPAQALCVLQ